MVVGTVADYKREIREHLRYMRECRIKQVSCFNGGLDQRTATANQRLFALRTGLKNAEDYQEALIACKTGAV